MKRIIQGLSQHDYQEVVNMGAEILRLTHPMLSKASIEESTIGDTSIFKWLKRIKGSRG